MRPVTSSLGYLGVAMLLAMSVSDVSSAEPPPRAPLDALWSDLMLEGSTSSVSVDSSGQRTVSFHRRPFDEQRGETWPESAAITTRGIRVSRLDERWLLQWGLGLGRRTSRPSEGPILDDRIVWEGRDPAASVCAQWIVPPRPADDEGIRVLSRAAEGGRFACHDHTPMGLSAKRCGQGRLGWSSTPVRHGEQEGYRHNHRFEDACGVHGRASSLRSRVGRRGRRQHH